MVVCVSSVVQGHSGLDPAGDQLHHLELLLVRSFILGLLAISGQKITRTNRLFVVAVSNKPLLTSMRKLNLTLIADGWKTRNLLSDAQIITCRELLLSYIHHTKTFAVRVTYQHGEEF